VVRLEQGAFDREHVFGDDPAATARAFRSAGAEWLHVVDLDGARTGVPSQAPTIAAILAAATEPGGPAAVRVQVAGGLRNAESVAAALTAGAARIVLGTAALRDPALVAELVRSHGPNRIAVAADIRDGLAIGDGWIPGAAGIPVATVLTRVEAAGAGAVIVTAIARDGLLCGPDLDLLDSVVQATSTPVIASGGIRSVEDLLAVRDVGCSGAIVGRALYDGSIDLPTALDRLASISPTRRPPGPATGQ
jgi:phosphoribosylformimino-5-aminoimidazole carboxamide ribotide isomerase